MNFLESAEDDAAMNGAGVSHSADALRSLAGFYRQVRQFTLRLCETVTAEDAMVQSMPDASPTKWHLAHTSWFFETFVLAKMREYTPYAPEYRYLYNSYYNTIGSQFPRPQRGLLSRPTWQEVLTYRQHVDEHMTALLQSNDGSKIPLDVITLGLHHEQQHQELLLTDIKHALACNPLRPVYRQACWSEQQHAGPSEVDASSWIPLEGGLKWIGHEGRGFAYDNEAPTHRVWLEPYQLAGRLVTCGQYLDFMRDGGYSRPELWLSDGWSVCQQQQWHAPLYWQQQDGHWHMFTLSGLRPVDSRLPVCHISFYEAEAFATWAQARLPTEFEWEAASEGMPVEGPFADALLDLNLPLHPPCVQKPQHALAEMFGHVWQWTSSSYDPYPGYRPAAGALGEYNGNFMCNQYVLRGGSCASSSSHLRPTYRNFFPPSARWQFSGIRLAKS